MSQTSPEPLRIRHRGWADSITAPTMANRQDQRAGLGLTNRSLTRDGRPWIPVSGEVHYSRLPQRQWRDTLRLMKAGGIDVVSTYVFWIHHHEREDQAPDFTGNFDVANFVALCQDVGLDVIIRLGPWCHGEVRNGGLPDWVVAGGYTERTDDPAYLAVVRAWFDRLGAQLAPLCGEEGPIIGIQIENELYDQRQHIVTLKQLVRDAGMVAPLWTATAWGSADIPVGEVFPLYGGYSDGFWVDTADGWDDSFRSHFFFSEQWDDPGIGKDLAGDTWSGTPGAKHPDFPAATCELAGGMATAYHRRPLIGGSDIAALSHVKIGSGSAWQGYYMFAGGTNPHGDQPLQESHATGYPNDMPVHDYDFQAPIGSHLQTRESFHRLRMLHTFLAAFGDRLGEMNSSFPYEQMLDVHDRSSLRWALRSDGRSGFVFINNHQPQEPLPDHPGISLTVELDDRSVQLPHRLVDIPSGAMPIWPVSLPVNDVMINWATLNVLTVLHEDQDRPVLVMVKTPGVAADLSVPASYAVHGHPVVGLDGQLVLQDLPTDRRLIELESADGQRLGLLVLDEEDGLRAWTPVINGRRSLVLSNADILEDDHGLLAVADRSVVVDLLRSSPAVDGEVFRRLHPAYDLPPASVQVQQIRKATEPPPSVIGVPGRASAPGADLIDRHSARFTLAIDGLVGSGRSLLRLELVGDVAVARVGDHVQDLFWNGSVWEIDLGSDHPDGRCAVELQIYPLTSATAIHLSDPVDQVRDALSGPAAQLDSATVHRYQSMGVRVD